MLTLVNPGPSFAKPSAYTHLHLPIPELTTPHQLLLKIHSSSLNVGEVQSFSTFLRFLELPTPANPKPPPTFPFKLGIELSGEVVAVGQEVKRFKAGDLVYGALPLRSRGTAAEYVLVDSTEDGCLALRPAGLTHNEAAAIPGAGVTGLQSFDIVKEGFRKDRKEVAGASGDVDFPDHETLRGKTVLVPAGLSATGSMAIQLVRHVYGDDSTVIITTLSPGKFGLLESYLGPNTRVDKVVDYTKGARHIVEAIGKGTVDVLYDTASVSLSSTYLSLMKPNTGRILSISSSPRGEMLKIHFPLAPAWIRWPLNIIYSVVKWRAEWYWGLNSYEVHLTVTNPGDLERLGDWIEQGKIRAVIGRVAQLDNLEAVREGCEILASGKGGVGKFVVQVV